MVMIMTRDSDGPGRPGGRGGGGMPAGPVWTRTRKSVPARGPGPGRGGGRAAADGPANESPGCGRCQPASGVAAIMAAMIASASAAFT